MTRDYRIRILHLSALDQHKETNSDKQAEDFVGKRPPGISFVQMGLMEQDDVGWPRYLPSLYDEQ